MEWMRRGWGIAFLALAAGLAAAGAVSCGGGESADRDDGAGAGGAGAGPSGPALEAVLAQYEGVIDGAPAHPKTQEALDALTAAVRQDGLTPQGGDPRDALLARFPDENLGLFVLQQMLDEKAEESPEAALAYCAEIRARFADNALGAMAFNRELDIELARGEAGFLDKCAASIELETPDKTTVVALFRRADHSVKQGRPKAAAVDYFRFWSMYPERVDEMRLRPAIMACLSKAGFVFEADRIAAAETAPAEAAVFFEEFRSYAGVESAEAPSDAAPGSMTGSEAYFHFAPDTAQILAAADPEAESPFDRTRLRARLSRLALNAGNVETTVETHLAYVDSARRLIDGENLDEETLQRFVDLNQTMLRESGNMLGRGSVESSLLRDMRNQAVQGRVSAGPDELLRALGDLHTRGVSHLAERAAARGAEAYAEGIERLVEAHKAQNNRKGVLDSYEQFLQRFPDSPLAPGMILKTADYYRDAWDSLGMAADACRKLVERYPDAPEVPLARMRQGLFLYQNEQYQEALDAFGTYLTTYPERPETGLVRFLCALCESSLGQSELSERHLQEILADYPDTDLAPRALFFLGSARMARQDYAAAREFFLDLVDQYPDSSFVTQAREYAERLEKVVQK